MRRLVNFLSGAMLGGLVGAGLALLLAPASGDDLRTQIQARTERIRDEMRSAAAARRAELEGQLSSLRASGGIGGIGGIGGGSEHIEI